MKLILLLVMTPISILLGMDLNNNNTAWPIALQKPTFSPQECLDHLTIEQKIAQLFMPGMQLNDPEDFEKITALINKYPIGGVLLTHSATLNTAVTYIQNLHDSNAAMGYPLPLWISIDAEWGLGMRLTDAISFPKAMTLGATDNDALVYSCGAEIGRQVSSLGAHINFAPVGDVNNNPTNPVIGIRSFGEDLQRVKYMAIAYIRGLEQHALGCAKHFPGHGDTNKDSHHELPIIEHDQERLWSVELEPFKALIKINIPMVMIAHLLIPTLDKELPTSLSSKVIDLLRKQMGFKGLVITDGLKMKAVADTYPSGELALLAFKAGNDIILQLDDTAAGIESLIAAYQQGEITQEQIDERVMRIWAAKKEHGLLGKDPRPNDYEKEMFHTLYAYDLQQRLYDAAMTLVHNDNRMLPIVNPKETVLIDIEGASYFAHELEQKGITVKRLSRVFDRGPVTAYLWSDFKNIIISIAGMNKFAHQSYGISEDTQYLCNYVQNLKEPYFSDEINLVGEKVRKMYDNPKKTAIVLFGLPYAASVIDHRGLLIAYEDCQAAQLAAAKVVLGDHKPTGKLPVSIGTQYPVGVGVNF